MQQMGLRFVVLTGVARDDLPDGGARIWAATIRAVRAAVPGCGVEVLPTDFKGGERDIATVIEAGPDVFAHNLETVRRLHGRIRPAFGYDRSLEVLRIAERLRAGQITKSNLILGMGEAPSEVAEALADLRDAGCDLVTIGQYLQPTKLHLPVDRWVTPDEFAEHKRAGEAMGIPHVEAGPLVRSSYHAGDAVPAGDAPRSPASVRHTARSKVEEPACKPDPVRPPRGGPATISLGARAPRRRSPAPCGLPGSSDGPSSNAPCLALLRVGLAEPARSPVPLVSSYLTVSPLPRATERARRSALCCASARSPPPGSPQHPALRSPDFPRPIRRSTAAARPAPPFASIPPRPERRPGRTRA